MGKKLGLFSKIAFLAVAVFLVISIIQMNIKINAKKEEYNRLLTERAAAKLNVEDLTEQLESPICEESIKRIAKEKLNLREPGELIFASDYRN